MVLSASHCTYFLFSFRVTVNKKDAATEMDEETIGSLKNRRNRRQNNSSGEGGGFLMKNSLIRPPSTAV